MTADLDDLLTRTAARPRTTVDPARIRDTARRRTRRRRAVTGGGLGLALVAAVALAVPLLSGDPRPVIDDAAGPSDDAQPDADVIELDLPDGWVQARIGDAVFGIPPGVEVREVASDDTAPCPNTDRVSTAHLAPEGWSAGGGCDMPGPSVTSLVAIPASAAPGTWASTPAEEVRVGTTTAMRVTTDLDGWVTRTYTFPTLDASLSFTALTNDPQLEADVLATLAPATGPAADGSLPDDVPLQVDPGPPMTDGGPIDDGPIDDAPDDDAPADDAPADDTPEDPEGTDPGAQDPGTPVTVGEVAMTVPDGIEVTTGGQQLPCHLDAMVAVLDALTPEPGPDCPAAGPSGTLVALVPASRVAPAFRPGEGDGDGSAQVDEVELLGTAGSREGWTDAAGHEAQSWWFPELDLHLEVRGAELTPDLVDELLASATRR